MCSFNIHKSSRTHLYRFFNSQLQNSSKNDSEPSNTELHFTLGMIITRAHVMQERLASFLFQQTRFFFSCHVLKGFHSVVSPQSRDPAAGTDKTAPEMQRLQNTSPGARHSPEEPRKHHLRKIRSFRGQRPRRRRRRRQRPAGPPGLSGSAMAGERSPSSRAGTGCGPGEQGRGPGRSWPGKPVAAVPPPRPERSGAAPGGKGSGH